MRVILAVSSFVGACWLMSYAHDIQNMILWAVSALYIIFFMLAQVYPVKKSPTQSESETQNNDCNAERIINFDEMQIK